MLKDKVSRIDSAYAINQCNLRILIFFIFFLSFKLSSSAQIGISLEKVNLFLLDFSNISQEKIYISSPKIRSLPSIESIMKAPALPNVYCAKDLAFFCRMEVNIENKTKFPIKFRLGDIDYVNWQEGKGFRRFQGY